MLRVGAVFVAILALLGACGASRPVNVSENVSPPAGIAPRSFSPAGLGITGSVPTTWREVPSIGNFKYTLQEAGPSHAFLAIATAPEGEVSIGGWGAFYAKGLRKNGATTIVRKSATVDGHGAVRLTYLYPSGTGTFLADTNYVIARGHDVVSVVLGEPAPGHQAALFRWIASTMRVT